MARKSFEIDVEPKILKWARETSGLSTEIVAKKMKLDIETVHKWENGEKKPTLVQLKRLSNIYKRPLAVFFLSECPKELPLPKDYRSLPKIQPKPFSQKTLLAIRQARRLQNIAIELSKLTERRIVSDIKKIDLKDDPESTANSIREWLQVSIDDQIKWKNERIAFMEWKKSIEKKGILVFQLKMPIDETRGFSFTDGEIPVIVINETDVTNAKIFTLFHELGHILLHKGGLCDLEDESLLSDEDAKIEIFCNHFAGALLVSKEALLKHDIVKKHYGLSKWSDDELNKLAKYFKVSKEVILRRLLILGLVDLKFYNEKREEWKLQTQGLLEKKKKGGRANPPKRCIQEIGGVLVSLILDSYRKDIITYSDVADYLFIRTKYIPKVEELVEGYI
jgi:Zn-dependent peptidase ImmA (M78 family)/DNA-binding XRE family transcriptional regulator